LALSTVKFPEICAEPPRIGSLMFGADKTTPSRIIANGLPVFSCVTRANLRLPCPSKLILTTGAFDCASKPCCALISSSPDTSTRRWTAMNGEPDGLPG